MAWNGPRIGRVNENPGNKLMSVQSEWVNFYKFIDKLPTSSYRLTVVKLGLFSELCTGLGVLKFGAQSKWLLFVLSNKTHACACKTII